MHKIKNQITLLSINNPLKTIVMTLAILALLIYGLKYFEQDDNMINLLPEEIGSRKIFEEIQENFELTEYMYVAVGNKNKSIFDTNDQTYSKEIISDIYNLTKAYDDESYNADSIDIVKRVISISTIYNMDDNTELMNDSSFPLSTKEINRIHSFLNNNPIMKERLLSNDNSYANIIVVPSDNKNYVALSKELHRISEKYEDKYEFHFGGQAYVTGAVPGMVLEEVVKLLAYGMILMFLILYINLKNLKAVLLILLTIGSSLFGMMGFMGWMRYLTQSNDFYFTIMNTSMPIVLLTIANSDGVHILSRFFKELRKTKDTRKAILETMDNLSLPIFLTSITTSAAFLMLSFSPVSAMLGYGVTLAFGIMWAWILSITFLPTLISTIKWDPNSKAINNANFIERLMKKFGNLVTYKPKKVMISGIIIVAISIIGIFFINVEVQYTKMFSPGNPIRDSAEFLDEYMTGNVNLILRASTSDTIANPFKEPKNLKEIERVQTYLDNFENVTSTISIVDVVKQGHKTIMADPLNEELSLFYDDLIDSIGNLNNFTYPAKNYETLIKELEKDSSTKTIIKKNFKKIELALMNEHNRLKRKYHNDFYTIPKDTIEVIQETCSTYIELESTLCYDCGLDGICPHQFSYDGPDEDGSEDDNIVDTIIINHGRDQIDDIFGIIDKDENGEEQLKPVINLSRDTTIITALMKTFSTKKITGYTDSIINYINQNQDTNIKYELTGMMVFIVDFMWLVIKASAWGIIYSVAIIFILSGLFFKSWRYGILSIIPLISAVFLCFGLMGWSSYIYSAGITNFEINLTHLTALLSSIIIGVGVDFTIHYISEYRKIKSIEKDENKISQRTIDNVGYPIILDAWSNMGFGALMLSSIIPLGQIGGLMVFAMIATSIGALTLLASTLEIFKEKLK